MGLNNSLMGVYGMGAVGEEKVSRYFMLMKGDDTSMK